MKPFDPRLLKYAKDARRYIVFLVVLGLLITASIIAQAFLISGSAAPVFYGDKTAKQVLPLIGILAGVFLLRVVLTWAMEAFGHRAALRVIADLRTRVLRHAGDLGDRWLGAGNTSSVATLTTRGLDDLEPYFVKFLPQLILCFTATPMALIVIFWLDWVSALAIIFCIPLIPIFMILIGKMTQKYSSERLQAMERLGSQLLDLLAGLTTLKALGREKGPQKRVKDLGDRFAKSTMQTLYVAFLSGAALEFLATLSTAIVAVEVGFRMVGGDVLLFEGLAIIMLTPEVFKPLREVGSQFHASADGVAAADAAFEIIETPLGHTTGTAGVPDLKTSDIVLDDVSVFAPGRATVAPANLSATIPPGSVAVLKGPSGSGKSTTVSVLLSLLAPDSGKVSVGSVDLATIDREAWWSNISWVPQRPVIVPGTVAENVVVTGPERDRAAELTGFSAVVESLPNGWDTVIGQGGVGLSVGQRQRLALTRALASDAPLVILDEPSAHLDAVSEEYVSDVVTRLKETGHTVIVIAHRAAIASLADVVIDVESSVREIELEDLPVATKHIVDYALPSAWTTSKEA